jgi:hypothetical protein
MNHWLVRAIALRREMPARDTDKTDRSHVARAAG